MSVYRMRKYLLPATIALVWFCGVGASPAEAYIDPGTGSHLFSSLGIMLGVATTCLAIGFFQMKRCGEWFLTRLTRRRRADDEPREQLAATKSAPRVDDRMICRPPTENPDP